MKISIDWASSLEDEDWSFMKQFILTSGSLKDLADYYKVSYPTIRLKLDRLIQKVKLSDSPNEDPFITKIKKMVLNEQLDFQVAKTIINEYRKNNEVK
jgi:hypothetical protein